jgi:hypothetical protein
MRGSRVGRKRTSDVSSDCDRIEPLLETYHDDALRETDLQAVRQHLRECARCSARLGAFGQVDRLLREEPPPAPPPTLRQGLYMRIAQVQQPADATRAPRMGGTSRPHARMQQSGAAAPAAHDPRRISVLSGGIAALTVVALLALVLSRMSLGVQRSAAGRTTAHTLAHVGTVAQTFAELPKFDDWRVAYLGTDRQVHIVSADGSRAVTAPSLPDDALLTTPPPAPYANVAASPDGHAVAYVAGSGIVLPGTSKVSAGPLTVVNLHTGAQSHYNVSTTSCYWSPDGSELVALSADPDVPALSIIHVGGDGSVTTVTPTYRGQVAHMQRVIGWTDNTHVLGIFSPSPGSLPQGYAPAANGSQLLAQPLSGGIAQIGLGVVDVATSHVRVLDNLPLEPETFLSPDGKTLFIPTSWWNDSALVMDTASGQYRELPAIARTFTDKMERVQTTLDAANANWSMHAAWLPGTNQVALSLAVGGPTPIGSPVSQPSGVWVLDLAADTATQVTSRTYPLAWLPGTSTLLTADPPGPQANGIYPAQGAGVGPTLYTLASPQGNGGREVRIAGSMSAYLGLVRTA